MTYIIFFNAWSHIMSLWLDRRINLIHNVYINIFIHAWCAWNIADKDFNLFLPISATSLLSVYVLAVSGSLGCFHDKPADRDLEVSVDLGKRMHVISCFNYCRKTRSKLLWTMDIFKGPCHSTFRALNFWLPTVECWNTK